MQLGTEISRVSPDAAIMTLHGRLTMGSLLGVTQAQITELIDSGVKRLLVDLAGVEYLDSAALGMLIHTGGALRSHGGELRVAGSNDRIAAVFKLTHTDQLLNLYANKETGLLGFAS